MGCTFLFIKDWHSSKKLVESIDKDQRGGGWGTDNLYPELKPFALVGRCLYMKEGHFFNMLSKLAVS